jgi:serine/threonine protein kinase
MLAHNGKPQLIDFGCACFLEPTASGKDAKECEKKTGVTNKAEKIKGDTDFVGTPQYMAPEIMGKSSQIRKTNMHLPHIEFSILSGNL